MNHFPNYHHIQAEQDNGRINDTPRFVYGCGIICQINRQANGQIRLDAQPQHSIILWDFIEHFLIQIKRMRFFYFRCRVNIFDISSDRHSEDVVVIFNVRYAIIAIIFVFMQQLNAYVKEISRIAILVDKRTIHDYT